MSNMQRVNKSGTIIEFCLEVSDFREINHLFPLFFRYVLSKVSWLNNLNSNLICTAKMFKGNLDAAK